MRIPFLNGMSGEPLPYLLHTDWMVTTLLLICILLTTIAFAKEKKYLLNRLKSSIASRERASMFDEATTTDVRYTFLLVLHSCILLGLCIYHYYTQEMPTLLEKIAHFYLLGGTILLVCFLFKKSVRFFFFFSLPSCQMQDCNLVSFQPQGQFIMACFPTRSRLNRSL